MADQDVVDIVLLVTRVAIGITLFTHGYQKFFMGGRIKGTAGWFESLGMKPGIVHAYTASCTEVSCGIGLALGLFTPLTAAGFVGTMFVAAWTHKGKFFVFKDDWEYNLVLALFAVVFATIGPGRWSLDRALGLDDEYFGLPGFLIAMIGLAGAVILLAVAWKPPAQEEPATS